MPFDDDGYEETESRWFKEIESDFGDHEVVRDDTNKENEYLENEELTAKMIAEEGRLTVETTMEILLRVEGGTIG